ncbi:MAG: Kazal-type serine protease inhibitor domain-containing protein [Myxococcota bacterium]
MRFGSIPLTLGILCLAACGGQDAGRISEACRSNADCEATELCATNLCEDGLGECIARPDNCDDVPVSLVCGCDGRTYDNSCSAELVGVRLAQQGACNCQDDSECVDNQFCESTLSCGNAGTCVDPPLMCLPESVGVCGCDGVDYESGCLAAQAGTRVSALGSCGCDTSEECGDGEFCNAITCDGPGVCASPLTSCSDGGTEIVGCDGVIYASVCEAEAAGARAPCTANSNCGSDNYCDGATCDGSGSCFERPTECPTEGPAVCGCDGQTYDNACLAAQAGERVEFVGTCPTES